MGKPIERRTLIKKESAEFYIVLWWTRHEIAIWVNEKHKYATTIIRFDTPSISEVKTALTVFNVIVNANKKVSIKKR